MTDLAYMVREDWAQRGTAMREQSTVIRAWLGEPPYVFATADPKAYRSDDSADRESASYIAGSADESTVIGLAHLRELRRGDNTLPSLIRVLVALHPYTDPDGDLLREVVASAALEKLFVIVWSPNDLVRTWLDGVGAVNLHTGKALKSPDPVQLEAARCWVHEQHNGLATGHGKAAVVQLLRVFTADGYPLDADTWLRAFFAAGGEFDKASPLAKLIREMEAGTMHRITERYRPDVLDLLRERASERR